MNPCHEALESPQAWRNLPATAPRAIGRVGPASRCEVEPFDRLIAPTAPRRGDDFESSQPPDTGLIVTGRTVLKYMLLPFACAEHQIAII
jgi:hypothetical protein